MRHFGLNPIENPQSDATVAMRKVAGEQAENQVEHFWENRSDALRNRTTGGEHRELGHLLVVERRVAATKATNLALNFL